MATDQIITEFLTKGEDNFRAALQGLTADMSTFEGRQARLGMVSGALASGGAGVIGMMTQMGGAALKSAGQMESIEAGLTSMLGSSDAAKAKIGELQQFARATPFDFGETAAASQQLLAMGVSADAIVPTMKSVGNAVAAAGGGTEQFRGVLTALGQIQTKGKMSQEELMQMAERGVPVFQILEKQLGLTKEQVANIGDSGVTAEQGIKALLDGMGAVGGGNALEEMSDTLPGKMANLGDSVGQLSASIGELFSSDAKDLITMVTNLTDRIREFVEESPGLAKGILGTVAAGAGLAVVAGGIGKLAGVYNEVTDAVGKATKGKLDLASATKTDDEAEKAKTGTAEDEGEAFGFVSDKVEEAKGQLEEMAKNKVDEFLKDPRGALSSWKSQITAFARSPLTVGGRGISQLGGGAVTNGVAAAGAALGVAAGYGAYDDYAAMGDDNAAMKGAATGIATAAAAMFLPGAAVPIAIATGFRYAFNELVNVPMEKAAEGNISDEEAASTGKMSRSEKEAFYFKKRDEAMAKGDHVEAQSFLLMANSQRRIGQREDKEKAEAAQAAEMKARAEEEREKMDKARRDEALWGDGSPEVGQVSFERSGARRVVLVIPASAADDAQRRNDYRNHTASPNYAR